MKNVKKRKAVKFHKIWKASNRMNMRSFRMIFINKGSSATIVSKLLIKFSTDYSRIRISAHSLHARNLNFSMQYYQNSLQALTLSFNHKKISKL